MADDAEIFLANVTKILAARGMTERALCMAATGKPDTLRNARRRNALPRVQALRDIADALGVTVEQLLRDDGADSPAATPRVADRRPAFTPEPLAGSMHTSPPKDVPVYGTAMGANYQPDHNGHGVAIESTDILSGEAIDMVRRPPALAWRRDVYGLYIVGTSMAPRFEPGDLVFVDPKRPAAIGDDVIVQIRRTNEYGDVEFETGLIKRLSRRFADGIEVEQFNPPARFRITKDRIAEVHRVMKTHELLG